MRPILMGLWLAATLAFGAQAQEVQPANPDIQSVIAQQLKAFQTDDVSAAFEFAAPNIRQMFRTPQNFGTMVERGYPMVWRPGDVRYLELREIANALWQRVEIVDQSGGLHRLDYRMSPVSGQWRISAVQILPVPDVSV